MGLQGVELVMDVEEAFGIQIPDELASELRTVGQLNDVVIRLLQQKCNDEWLGRPDWDRAVWQKVCELSANLSNGVEAADVVPSTRFVEDLGYG